MHTIPNVSLPGAEVQLQVLSIGIASEPVVYLLVGNIEPAGAAVPALYAGGHAPALGERRSTDAIALCSHEKAESRDRETGRGSAKTKKEIMVQFSNSRHTVRVHTRQPFPSSGAPCIVPALYFTYIWPSTAGVADDFSIEGVLVSSTASQDAPTPCSWLACCDAWCSETSGEAAALRRGRQRRQRVTNQ